MELLERSQLGGQAINDNATTLIAGLMFEFIGVRGFLRGSRVMVGYAAHFPKNQPTTIRTVHARAKLSQSQQLC